MLITANKLVHFGWKKEAIPVTQTKKSIIARFFDTFFGKLLLFLETLVVLRFKTTSSITIFMLKFIKKHYLKK
jgi:hypothetical protein